MVHQPGRISFKKDSTLSTLSFKHSFLYVMPKSAQWINLCSCPVVTLRRLLGVDLILNSYVRLLACDPRFLILSSLFQRAVSKGIIVPQRKWQPARTKDRRSNHFSVSFGRMVRQWIYKFLFSLSRYDHPELSFHLSLLFLCRYPTRLLQTINSLSAQESWGLKRVETSGDSAEGVSFLMTAVTQEFFLRELTSGCRNLTLSFLLV